MISVYLGLILSLGFYGNVLYCCMKPDYTSC